jgi:hypothetical protein
MQRNLDGIRHCWIALGLGTDMKSTKFEKQTATDIWPVSLAACCPGCWLSQGGWNAQGILFARSFSKKQLFALSSKSIGEKQKAIATMPVFLAACSLR